jgi:murein DD-endopeptidase MepM/ murein hydrolase activator NlpD
MINVIPPEAHGAKQKGQKKESPKAKTTGVSSTRKPPAPRVSKPDPEPAPNDGLEKRKHVVYRIRAADSWPRLLGRFRLPQSERTLWSRAIQRNFKAKRLPVGREVHFYFSNKPPGALAKNRHLQLKALEIDYNEASILTWEKDLKGIVFQAREKPYDVEIKTVAGTVENSLVEESRKIGVPPTLLSQLVDIFTWDIDIEKEIRSGDSFKILYEQRSRKGQEAKTSLRILAAELTSAGQKLTAIYFEGRKGQGNYFNLEGRSLARSFLRFPLEFINISSHFSHSRFHPVLKVSMPHTGVDFAAKRGTPVRAVGDGIISLASRNGPYGRTVDIQHDLNYLSRYAHLDKFADGIVNGVAVKKGEIIGYVGSSGRSTGPHLHFELYKDQQYIDPLSADFPADEVVEPALQKLFDSQKQLFLVELTAAPQS